MDILHFSIVIARYIFYKFQTHNWVKVNIYTREVSLFFIHFILVYVNYIKIMGFAVTSSQLHTMYFDGTCYPIAVSLLCPSFLVLLSSFGT